MEYTSVMKMRVTIGLFNVSLKSLSFSPVKHSVECSHFIYFDWCDIACFGYLVHGSYRQKPPSLPLRQIEQRNDARLLVVIRITCKNHLGALVVLLGKIKVRLGSIVLGVAMLRVRVERIESVIHHKKRYA